MGTQESYSHTPLSSNRNIRILVLHPARKLDAPINCTLREVSLDHLDKASSYEALSYVWGSPVGDREIFCHGKSNDVTENCLLALRYLRYKWRDRTLWIDAICIDQKSVPERNQQVALMGDVYKRARRVAVLLGIGDADTNLLFWCFRALSLNVKATSLTTLDNKSKRKLELLRELLPSSVLRSLPALLQHDWFTRAWVLQEIILASDPVVFCRRRKLAWTHFAVLAGICCKRLENGPSIYESLLRIDGLRVIYWKVDLVKYLQCSDPKDHIYALYRIWANFELLLPSPNYDLSVATIYQDATSAIIRSTRSLSVLLLAASPNRRRDLPSWVPDYGDDKRYRTHSLQILSLSMTYFRKDYNPIFEQGRIIVEGFPIGRVSSTTSRIVESPKQLSEKISKPSPEDPKNSYADVNNLEESVLEKGHREAFNGSTGYLEETLLIIAELVTFASFQKRSNTHEALEELVDLLCEMGLFGRDWKQESRRDISFLAEIISKCFNEDQSKKIIPETLSESRYWWATQLKKGIELFGIRLATESETAQVERAVLPLYVMGIGYQLFATESHQLGLCAGKAQANDRNMLPSWLETSNDCPA